MPELTVPANLNPVSAKMLAASSGADSGSNLDPLGEFAALLSRQLDATLAGGAVADPLAALLAKALPQGDDQKLIPDDLAALLAAGAAFAPGATMPTDTALTARGKPSDTGELSALAGDARRSIADNFAADDADAAKLAAGAADAAARGDAALASHAATREEVPANVQALDTAIGAPTTNSLAAHAHPQQNTAAAPLASRIETTVGTPAWGNEVGQRLVWMAARDRGQAELTLTPPSLGKIEVVLSVQGTDASAHFVSASAPVREALEQALPRLREVFAQAGLSLGQTSVNAENPQRDAPEQQQFAGGRGDAAPTQDVLAPVRAASWTQRGNGLVDTFA